MLIRPQQKLRDKLFYNNILFILCAFSILCFLTSLWLQDKEPIKIAPCANNKILPTAYFEPKENTIWGPIKINNKAKIYKITARFSGSNSASYLTGEVLDEDKETLYEFGKDMWHESGYDSEGYWSESDRKMSTYLTFKEKGTYYIQFSSDNIAMSYPDGSIALSNGRIIQQNQEMPRIKNITIYITQLKSSYIPHAKVGTLILLLVMVAFYIINKQWIKEKYTMINEYLEEMSDD